MLFWYFYPILAGKIIPYSDWLSHMWYTRLDLTGRTGAEPSTALPAVWLMSVLLRVRLSLLPISRHILKVI